MLGHVAVPREAGALAERDVALPRSRLRTRRRKRQSVHPRRALGVDQQQLTPLPSNEAPSGSGYAGQGSASGSQTEATIACPFCALFLPIVAPRCGFGRSSHPRPTRAAPMRATSLRAVEPVRTCRAIRPQSVSNPVSEERARDVTGMSSYGRIRSQRPGIAAYVSAPLSHERDRGYQHPRARAPCAPGALLAAFGDELRAAIPESAPESTRTLAAAARRRSAGEMDEEGFQALLSDLRAIVRTRPRSVTERHP